mgnify:CR=1 FL=1
MERANEQLPGFLNKGLELRLIKLISAIRQTQSIQTDSGSISAAREVKPLLVRDDNVQAQPTLNRYSHLAFVDNHLRPLGLVKPLKEAYIVVDKMSNGLSGRCRWNRVCGELNLNWLL